MNQREPPERGFVSPGTFHFEKGRAGYVEAGSKGADGHVVVDAVQWLPARD